jgi:hypothetical protein
MLKLNGQLISIFLSEVEVETILHFLHTRIDCILMFFVHHNTIC